MNSVGDEGPTLGAIVLRAILCAIALTALILFAPTGGHAFVYLGF